MNSDAFVDWLADSPMSLVIGAHAWITPAVQTVHILAIAAIMAAILMTNLKALGAVGRGQSLQAFSRRYGPWIIGALLVLLVSGSTLIIGEPRRSLQNPIFVLKMGLLAAALILTVSIHAPVLRDAAFWNAGGRSIALKGVAGVSLAVWAAIIFAGRWIAYAVT